MDSRSPDDRSDLPQVAQPGRRNLLRAGVGAAPVLLTLVSRPVAAADSCVVASSFVSVATYRSRNPTATTLRCSTRTIEEWYTQACLPASGAPNVRPAVLSTLVYQLLGSTTSSYNGKALWEVLKNGTSGIVQSGELGVLQHLIGMALNVQGGFAPVAGGVSVAYLQLVWQNYKSNAGYYRLPASGIDWDSPKVVSWLRLLMNPGTLTA